MGVFSFLKKIPKFGESFEERYFLGALTMDKISKKFGKKGVLAAALAEYFIVVRGSKRPQVKKYYKLCPHHLRIFMHSPREQKYKHLRYGKALVSVLVKIMEDIFEGKAGVEVVEYKDDICRVCPYMQKGECVHPDYKKNTKGYLIAYERKVAKDLGVKIGDKLSSTEVFGLLRKKFGSLYPSAQKKLKKLGKK